MMIAPLMGQTSPFAVARRAALEAEMAQAKSEIVAAAHRITDGQAATERVKTLTKAVGTGEKRVLSMQSQSDEKTKIALEAMAAADEAADAVAAARLDLEGVQAKLLKAKEDVELEKANAGPTAPLTPQTIVEEMGKMIQVGTAQDLNTLMQTMMQFMTVMQQRLATPEGQAVPPQGAAFAPGPSPFSPYLPAPIVAVPLHTTNVGDGQTGVVDAGNVLTQSPADMTQSAPTQPPQLANAVNSNAAPLGSVGVQMQPTPNQGDAHGTAPAPTQTAAPPTPQGPADVVVLDQSPQPALVSNFQMPMDAPHPSALVASQSNTIVGETAAPTRIAFSAFRSKVGSLVSLSSTTHILDASERERSPHRAPASGEDGAT